MEDSRLRRCLELAEQARKHGESPVGAVIERGQELIAEAAERVRTDQDVTAHAELLAIRYACRALGTTNLSDCTLYTTVEPCWMCAFAIRETQISRVVISKPIKDIGAVTSRCPILTDAEIPDWGAPPKIEWRTDESAA